MLTNVSYFRIQAHKNKRYQLMLSRLIISIWNCFLCTSSFLKRSWTKWAVIVAPHKILTTWTVVLSLLCIDARCSTVAQTWIIMMESSMCPLLLWVYFLFGRTQTRRSNPTKCWYEWLGREFSSHLIPSKTRITDINRNPSMVKRQ